MHDVIAFLVDVRQLGGEPDGLDAPVIGDLTARLRVARGAVEHQLELVLAVRPPAPQAEPAGRERLVAQELGVRPLAHHGPRRAAGAVVTALELARRAGPLALLLHRRVEPGAVHRHVPLRGDLLGQLDRKAVGVVEGERVGAADAGRPAGQQLLEARESGFEGLDEALLLTGQHQPLATGAVTGGIPIPRGEVSVCV